MNNYKNFEDTFRGSRELIKSRVRIFLPLVKELLAIYPHSSFLDIGCGRGEWLETVKDLGGIPVGVDLDASMVNTCKELGLTVHKADAISYMGALPANSQAMVTAFHVVEHITFDELNVLLAGAIRVLKPGGILIMETPNPENIIVATSSFYIDPTHKRPIPIELLKHLAKDAGFFKVEGWGLQEDYYLHTKTEVNLHDIFYGVSPDYAVLAQKKASNNILSSFDPILTKRTGLKFDFLLQQWDKGYHQFQLRLKENESLIKQAQELIYESNLRVHESNLRVHESNLRVHESHEEIKALLNSRSWRLTKPFRRLNHMSQAFLLQFHCSKFISIIKGRLKKKFIHLAAVIQERPNLRKYILLILNCFPPIREKLRSLLIVSEYSLNESSLNDDYFYSGLIKNLSPNAKLIYEELKERLNR
jgi:O-antigen chain-terminating methyltransferase